MSVGTLDGSNMGLNEKSIYFVCNKKSKSEQMAGFAKIQMQAKNKKTAFL